MCARNTSHATSNHEHHAQSPSRFPCDCWRQNLHHSKGQPGLRLALILSLLNDYRFVLVQLSTITWRMNGMIPLPSIHTDFWRLFRASSLNITACRRKMASLLSLKLNSWKRVGNSSGCRLGLGAIDVLDSNSPNFRFDVCWALSCETIK